jgi:hypothetical protein
VSRAAVCSGHLHLGAVNLLVDHCVVCEAEFFEVEHLLHLVLSHQLHIVVYRLLRCVFVLRKNSNVLILLGAIISPNEPVLVFVGASII